MRTTTDLLMVRWRTAQWCVALLDGDTAQAAALLAAMRVEGVDRRDALDEFTLLRAQFGHRPRCILAQEVERVAAKLRAAAS